MARKCYSCDAERLKVRLLDQTQQHHTKLKLILTYLKSSFVNTLLTPASLILI